MRQMTILLLGGALLLANAGAVWAQQKDSAGWVTSKSGDVRFTANAKAPPQTLQNGQAVLLGMTLITARNSAVRILFINDQVLTLNQNSKLTITEYLAGTQKSKTTLDLAWGRLRAAITAKLRYASGDRFEIRTKNAVAGVRGSILGVEYDPGKNTTNAGCGAGDCYVTGGGKTTDLDGGQGLKVVGSEMGPVTELKPGDPGYYDPQGQYDNDGGGNDSPADEGVPPASGGGGASGQDQMGGLNNPQPDLDPLILDVFGDGEGNPYENYGHPPEPPREPQDGRGDPQIPQDHFLRK